MATFKHVVLNTSEWTNRCPFNFCDTFLYHTINILTEPIFSCFIFWVSLFVLLGHGEGENLLKGVFFPQPNFKLLKGKDYIFICLQLCKKILGTHKVIRSQ